MKQLNLYFRMLNYIPVVVVLVFVAVLVIGAVFLWPKYQKLNEIEASIAEKESELYYKSEYYVNLESLKAKLADYPEELAKINSAIPPDPSLPSVFNFLQETSSESGLVLYKLSPFSLAEKEEATLKESNFILNLMGSYSSFKDFVSAIEKSARMIELESISFSETKEETTFDFQVSLKTYSY